MNELREDICRKLRKTVLERGQKAVTPAIIIGPYDIDSPIGGHTYILCPTLGDVRIGNVDFKTARFFEDAYPTLHRTEPVSFLLVSGGLMLYCRCPHPKYGFQYSPIEGGPCGMAEKECQNYCPRHDSPYWYKEVEETNQSIQATAKSRA